MASNLKRSKRTVGKRVNDLSKRVSRLQKNPAARRLGRHVINEDNLDPGVIIDINTGVDVAVDFYGNNNQNSTIPTTPGVNGDGTAITHVINTDSTATITFNWNYTTTDVEGDASNIDGFVVHVYQSTSSSPYSFTSSNLETTYFTDRTKRSFVLVGVPADKYYTLGVKAYRSVDSNISTTGVLYSPIEKSTFAGENPFQPSASISYTGTINGIAASTISTAATNFSNNNDQNATTPTEPVVLTDGTAVDHTLNTDGSADISFEWTYSPSTTQGAANNIDGFAIHVHSNPQYAISAISTTGSVVTYTTGTVAHGYAAGETVVVSGVTPTGYNGTFTVLASPAPTTTAFSVTNATTGTATLTTAQVFGSSTYTFGTAPATETIYYVNSEKRAFVLSGVAANLYYTFGVRAYRSVDSNIGDGSGVLYNASVVKSTRAEENPYQPSSTVAFTGNIGATVGSAIAASTISTAATNFSNNNDQNATTPTAPTINSDGTAIDHVLNTDASADISFEWTYSPSTTQGAANNIDGFAIYVYSSTSATAITFGSAPATADKYTVYYVNADRRAFILSGVSPDLYYTFGVRAYRSVDSNIGDGSGVLYNTTIVQPTFAGENPFQPSSTVAFTGNIGGTLLTSVPASSVYNATTNFNANNDQILDTPNTPTSVALTSSTQSVTATFDLAATWSFDNTGDAGNVDGFVAYLRTIQPIQLDSISASGSVVTYTTKTNHGFSAGNSVVISGVIPVGYEGTFNVLASPAPTSNTFAVTNATTGTALFTTAQVYSGTAAATDISTSDLTTNIQSAFITAEARGYTFTGMPAGSIYKVAVIAYRVVDTNINAAGVIYGALENSGTLSPGAPSLGGANGANNIYIGNGKLYIGTGNYANVNTGFYVDSGGFFSLKDKLTWNGTTLAISGDITATNLTATTSGTIANWTINSSGFRNTDGSVRTVNLYPAVGSTSDSVLDIKYGVTRCATTAGGIIIYQDDSPEVVYTWLTTSQLFMRDGFIDAKYYLMSSTTTSTSDDYIVRDSSTGRMHVKSSNRDLKENISSISNSLTTIDKLSPQTFNWKMSEEDEQDEYKVLTKQTYKTMGFVLEDVLEVSPELVTWRKNREDGSLYPGYWKTDDFIALAIQGIKDLNKKVSDLELQILDLKRQK